MDYQKEDWKGQGQDQPQNQQQGEVREGQRQSPNTQGNQTGMGKDDQYGSESASRSDQQTNQGLQYQNAQNQRDNDQNEAHNSEQEGTFARDGAISQNEAGKGADLNDIGNQMEGSDADYATSSNIPSDFNEEQNDGSDFADQEGADKASSLDQDGRSSG